MVKVLTWMLLTVAVLLVGCESAQPGEDSNSVQEQPIGKKLYIIVHKDNPQTTLDKSEIKNIYLGVQSRWANLVNIERYDYPPAQQFFYEKVLGMPMLEVNRYWSQQKIMGGYRPPLVAKRLKEMMPLFQRDAGAVAYVPTKNLPKHVKIVAEFDIDR